VRLLQFETILIAAIVTGTAMTQSAQAATPDGSLSLGYPNAGRLVGGRQFRETPYMVMVPAHSNSRVRWATSDLLSVLSRASRLVSRKFPGSVMEIGELSTREGGPITSHLSHQNGRDADIGFYIVDLDGEPVRAPKFVRFDGSGASRDDPTLRFDEKRNWAFVRAVLEDTRSDVRQIFIYAPLRARLLAYAAQIGAPRQIRAKAAAAMMQPVNALPHDDHFHIRISCPIEQLSQGCTDLPLWHAPGSPDEFGPELLAEAPGPRADGLPSAFAPESWGRISKLWSSERGVCDKSSLACQSQDDGPVCEDLGEFGGPPPFLPQMPIDGDLVATSTPSNPSVPSASLLLADDAGQGPTTTQAEPTYCAAIIEHVALRCTMNDVWPPPASAARGLTAPEWQTSPRAERLALGSRDELAPDFFDRRRLPGGLLYCAPDEEPNACERPMAVLASKAEPDPASDTRGGRSILQ